MTTQEIKQLSILACKVRMGTLSPHTPPNAVIPAAACLPRSCLPICITRN